jgi:hypothetical protein
VLKLLDPRLRSVSQDSLRISGIEPKYPLEQHSPRLQREVAMSRDIPAVAMLMSLTFLLVPFIPPALWGGGSRPVSEGLRPRVTLHVRIGLSATKRSVLVCDLLESRLCSATVRVHLGQCDPLDGDQPTYRATRSISAQTSCIEWESNPELHHSSRPVR